MSTTHVGSLARPPGLLDLMKAAAAGEPVSEAELTSAHRSAVADVVARQRAHHCQSSLVSSTRSGGPVVPLGWGTCAEDGGGHDRVVPDRGGRAHGRPARSRLRVGDGHGEREPKGPRPRGPFASPVCDAGEGH